MLDRGQCVYSISVIYIPYVTYVCRFRLCIAEQRFPVVLWVGKPRGGGRGGGFQWEELQCQSFIRPMDTLAALHYSALNVLEKDWLGGEKIELSFSRRLSSTLSPGMWKLTIVFKDPSLFLCTKESRKRSSLGCYLVRFPDWLEVGNLTWRCYLEEGPGWELILEQTLPRRFFSPVTFRMCSSQSKNTNILLRANI